MHRESSLELQRKKENLHWKSEFDYKRILRKSEKIPNDAWHTLLQRDLEINSNLTQIA